MKNRNTNLELLRILSIFMIIVSHYSIHNSILASSLDIGFNRFLLEIVTLGDIGSILFVLISGYCLINSVNIKLRKILKILLQVLFYSLAIYLLFLFFGNEDFSLKFLVKSILPISFKQYWFATAYIILYIFHPYINKLLNSFNKKEHFIFIIINLIIFSLLHMITTNDYYGNELVQFTIFYSIGAYFSKYKTTFFSNNKLNYVILVSSVIISISSIVLFDFLGQNYSIFATNSRYFLNRTSIFSILIAISLFNIFINRKAFYNKYINIISNCVFGVYLISDNVYMRKFLWLNVFNNSNYLDSNYLIFHMFISTITVFIVCIFIELIRQLIIERVFEKCFFTKLDVFQEKMVDWYESK